MLLCAARIRQHASGERINEMAATTPCHTASLADGSVDAFPLVPGTRSQPGAFGGLSDDVLLDNSEDIAGALAGPREPAFLRVLTEASIVQQISRYRLRLRPGRPFRPDALSRSTRGVLLFRCHGPVYPAG